MFHLLAIWFFQRRRTRTEATLEADELRPVVVALVFQEVRQDQARQIILGPLAGVLQEGQHLRTRTERPGHRLSSVGEQGGDSSGRLTRCPETSGSGSQHDWQ